MQLAGLPRPAQRCLRRAPDKFERCGLGGEREAITLLEGGNVFDVFVASVADFEQIGFEQRNAVGEEFGQRAVQVFAERGIQRILEICARACRPLRRTSGSHSWRKCRSAYARQM